MGVLTIRNVDDDVIARLKARARANHRSLEGELRYLLERSAAPRSALGVVRERARMAASYNPNQVVPNTAPDVVEPPTDACPEDDGSGAWMGAMGDVGEIVGDIVSPATDPSDWVALRAETGEMNDIEKP